MYILLIIFILKIINSQLGKNFKEFRFLQQFITINDIICIVYNIMINKNHYTLYHFLVISFFIFGKKKFESIQQENYPAIYKYSTKNNEMNFVTTVTKNTLF